MSLRITDRFVKDLELPKTGNRITYDDQVPGFGIRVTAAGAKSFVLNYRIGRRERRYTIGPYGVDQWTVAAARKRAGELRKMIERGEDPLAEKIGAREAPTVADLCQRFREDHFPKTRPSTRVQYDQIIDNDILPNLRHRKVAEVSYSDIDSLHRKVTKRGAPYRANRVVAVLSKMFTLANKWEWRPADKGNPAKGIERNQEVKRRRYLSADELGRLTAALTTLKDQQAANIIRMLLLTGARSGEVRFARWDQFDLESGTWTKPGATTKQKTDHSVPLSAPARQLLVELREAARDDAEYVFSRRNGNGHRSDIKDQWSLLCKAADIKNARIHDLRHTYASVLASAGLSLPVIGALLGHTQPQTTARYSHLFDDPLRQATERAGAIISGGKTAKVLPLRKGG